MADTATTTTRSGGPAGASPELKSSSKSRLTKVEAVFTEVAVIKTTLAREIADLKLAKTASAFAMEEKNLRPNPQDKDAWRKKTEEEKKETIETLLKVLLGDKRGQNIPI